MKLSLTMLVLEAMAAYFLVLWTHSLRRRVGQAFFYALLGGLTAVMSWVTDAGAKVDIGIFTFIIGSSVFYTSLLLGVFVVYVFDGPRAARIAIATVAGVSAMVPLIAATVHLQMNVSGQPLLVGVPVPSLRINTASVIATVADLVFLAMAWEVLGKPELRMRLWLRTFLALLGVMWLDVVLFTTIAFAGKPEWLGIMAGTIISRLVISVFACLFLYLYLNWQNRIMGMEIGNRPVLAILKEVADVRGELTLAQQEIARRKAAEQEKESLIRKLEATLAQVRKLEGLLPVCSNCKRIRVAPLKPGDPDRWIPLEAYVRRETSVQFTHGMCLDCMRTTYPDLPEHVLQEASRTESKKSPER